MVIYVINFSCFNSVIPDYFRLNCHQAAMRSLRMARNHATSDHERLVYEGWISYDTGHLEEALAKAEEAIAIKRSFEAFFLKAYAMTDPDSNLDSASSTYIVQLLEEALRCPSDGLRKGQVSICFINSIHAISYAIIY